MEKGKVIKKEIEDIKEDLRRARYELKIAKTESDRIIAEDNIMSLESELRFLRKRIKDKCPKCETLLLNLTNAQHLPDEIILRRYLCLNCGWELTEVMNSDIEELRELYKDEIAEEGRLISEDIRNTQ